MKIAVINPNSTASMTEKIRAAAAGAAFCRHGSYGEQSARFSGEY